MARRAAEMTVLGLGKDWTKRRMALMAEEYRRKKATPRSGEPSGRAAAKLRRLKTTAFSPKAPPCSPKTPGSSSSRITSLSLRSPRLLRATHNRSKRPRDDGVTKTEEAVEVIKQAKLRVEKNIDMVTDHLKNLRAGKDAAEQGIQKYERQLQDLQHEMETLKAV